MRLLILSDVPPGTIGGAEVQALGLARKWAADGHRVLVAGPTNVPMRSGNLEVLRIPTLRSHRALRAVSYVAASCWMMWRRRAGFDLVYCRFLREQAFVAALARCLGLVRKPVVACPACASANGDVADIERSPVRWLWVAVFRRGLAVINAMSRQIEREVATLGLASPRISRIPNAVMIPEAVAGSGKRADGPLRLLFAGRLVEQKGLDNLLAALSRVSRDGRSVELAVAGDGPLRPQLERTVGQLGLAGCVHFLGRLSPEAMLSRYPDADLFVLPSRYEGMPGALLEAIAHGLPVVATRVSGSEDIVEESFGWLVPVDDAEALAEAIVQALDAGANRLERMGAAARAHAIVHYDADVVAARYIELFEDVLAARP